MSSSTTQTLHLERLPKSGALVIPGRLDLPHLHHLERIFAGRKITWLIEESSQHEPSLRAFLEKSNSGAMFSAGDSAPAAAGTQLKAFLANGGVLIYVPGGAKPRLGSACHIQSSHLKTLTSFGLPVLPIAIDCPRESHLITESPASLPPAIFCIGKLLNESEVSLANYQQNLFEAFEEAYATRPIFKSSLTTVLVQGLKRNAKCRVLDGSDDSELTYHKVLAVAIAFSKVIKEETNKPRVAIILPPGKAGLIANLAVLLAGKTPINLNFTAGHDSIKSSMRQSGVDRYITADPFVRKVSSFPWPPNRDIIFIERILPSLKQQVVKWALITKIMPTKALTLLLNTNKRRGDDEATLLFTSGSAGEPKGVVLNHRNVLGNVCQFATRLGLPKGSAILGSLPLFHSFGCTVTLWFPVIEGIDLVTYPSPLETKRLAELIALHQIKILLATPTFLRGYMKRIDPAQLASLQYVITGAEKLPQSLADAFEQKFGMRPQEGYGLTETSPVTNVNLPEPEVAPGITPLPSSRNGSVGQLIPGLAIKLTDPATNESVPLDKQGIIWFKGPNVFNGYLDNPTKSAEVLVDGWFRTGDVGRVDEDGFLYIEGRISRFSKIAGEMVPHETVEAAINKVLELDSESERKIAIVGVPDEQKGEAILLLSTIAGPAHEQECIDLRYKLLDLGLPSLWCPKQIIPVAEIPVLASGKLDIKGCEMLAKKAE
ncbi:AMP-binding protein [Luteolibacter pohnpeiensis]|uniref:AMP-binding protein n=1 Tax=Luteolibacter pohnpeiensis TaxID=454153 RepID=A0A934VUW6_9BACT|nr:AMP-binding protein [Luteolibacter pohnpeiensis]MBK1882967.1 AMP-binding protein [Luteolibacter pohnpeiensis]